MGSRGRPRGGRDRGREAEPEPRRPEPAPEPASEAASASASASDPASASASASAGRAEEEGAAPEPGGRAERRRLARRVRRRRRTRRAGELPLLVVVALCIALLLKTFLVQAFFIPSGSMEQTIRIGDRVLVDKLTPWFGAKVERGDVVVFKDPGGWLKGEAAQPDQDPAGIKQIKEALTFIGLLPSADEQDLIKRVVGVGGDTVKCCDARGRVTVNGAPLDEPYVSPGNAPSEIRFEVHVPKGRLFVMGDHRANSADSRYHLDEAFDGTIDENGVVGQAVVIAWPFDHWRRLEQPATFLTVPDPARTGRRRGRLGRRRGTAFA
ncbi:signal peptidase I [Streptomyces lavendulae]|uniref:signal peptidase I n=1 Tax=Streptomyces lavendulae TaxID=1914 RepID=UPI0036C3C5EE